MTHINHLPSQLIIHQSNHLSVANFLLLSRLLHLAKFNLLPSLQSWSFPEAAIFTWAFHPPGGLWLFVCARCTQTVGNGHHFYDLLSLSVLAQLLSCLPATCVAMDSSSRRFASCLLSYLLQQLSAIHHESESQLVDYSLPHVLVTSPFSLCFIYISLCLKR